MRAIKPVVKKRRRYSRPGASGDVCDDFLVPISRRITLPAGPDHRPHFISAVDIADLEGGGIVPDHLLASEGFADLQRLVRGDFGSDVQLAYADGDACSKSRLA